MTLPSDRELAEQWEFLDTLIDRQAAALKSQKHREEDYDTVVTADIPTAQLATVIEERDQAQRRTEKLEAANRTLDERIRRLLAERQQLITAWQQLERERSTLASALEELGAVQQDSAREQRIETLELQLSETVQRHESEIQSLRDSLADVKRDRDRAEDARAATFEALRHAYAVNQQLEEQRQRPNGHSPRRPG